MLCEKSFSFTLAEILIVIGILGLVADMTLPTLVQNFQEKTTVVKLKKFYSVMNQAFNMAVSENGSPEEWVTEADLTNPQAAEIYYNNLKKHLSLIKDCGLKTNCLGYSKWYFKYLDNTGQTGNFGTTPNFGKGVMADGTYFWISIKRSDCKEALGLSKALQHVCAAISIDINGYKKPNTMGKDFFYFYITKYGIVPRGADTKTDIENESFDNCINGDGSSCAAWVIYNENMDYLHCSDLLWDGKKRCK